MTHHDLQHPDTWLAKLPPILTQLCQHIADAGGQAWLVGGCVRDLCLAVTPKDLDLEVYGLDEDALLQSLKKIGRVEQVGKQFGVIKLFCHGMAFDLALPRTESKTATGHRGFDVACNPHLSPEIATLRRDFTINAMMFDPLKQQLIDLHGGKSDLQNGILRHVSPAFCEDPLRPLRAMQFAARFKLSLAPETADLCQKLLSEAHSLPSSRIWCEWQKWTHAAHPSFGLIALRDSAWLSLYPELQCLIDCPQDARWHPEGNTWIHTLMVCDQAAQIAQRQGLDSHASEHLLLAALCHDLGKPTSTFTDEEGNIRSPNHSAAGIGPTQLLLTRIHAPKRIAEFILPLVYDHITHLSGEPTPRAIRRLAHRLEPASIELWEMLVEADASGRHPSPACRPALPWLEKAQEANHHIQKPKAIITGDMLIEKGMQPGKNMGLILKSAYNAQLDGDFDSISSAQAWLENQHLDESQ